MNAKKQSPAHKNYTIRQALTETFKAVEFNKSGFFGAVLATFILGWFAFIVLDLLLNVLGHLRAVGSGLVITTIVLLLWLVGTVMLYAAFATVLNNVMSLVLYASSHKIALKVSDAITQGVRRFLKVTAMSLTLLLMIYGPFVVLGILAFTSLFSQSFATSTSFLSLMLLLAAFVWGILIFFRYALVPYVALFEGHLTLRETFGRSRELLSHGGQWFLLKGIGFTFLFLIVLSAVTDQSVQELDDTNNILIIVILFAFEIIINGALTMFYKNTRTRKTK